MTLSLRALVLAALAPALIFASPVSAQVGFTDVTAAMGITATNQYGPVLPLDTDMLPLAAQQLNIIQRNAGNGAAVADYDNDGDLDILLLSQKGYRVALYRNNLPAPNFTNVTAQAGLFNRGQSRVASFIDLDNDGWKDLIIANDRRADAPTCDHEVEPLQFRSVTALPAPGPVSAFHGQQNAGCSIYRNNGDGSFDEVTLGSGFTMSGYVIGGMGFVDFDQDGRMDI